MTRVVVYHDFYGCTTGCCGHSVQIEGEDEKSFDFGDPSPFDDPLEFAKDFVYRRLGEEHVKDLDWEHCLILDDEHRPLKEGDPFEVVKEVF